MNRIRKLAAKVITAAAISSLVAAGGSTVYAAEDSYQEVERAAYGKFVSGATSLWDQYLENYQKGMQGSKGVMTLTVEDTGRALLGTMAGMDLSWLKNLSFDMNISVQDGMEAITSAILLNDSKLCDLNLYMDLAKLTEYIQIPDISEGYLQAPIQSSDSTEISEDSIKLYFDVLSDLSSMAPDKDTVNTLLDRYGTLVIDNIEDNSSSEESVHVEGISEDCTTYEGRVYKSDAQKMAEQIVETAKDDKEIKEMFDSWAKAGTVKEDQYQLFQDGADSLLADIKDETDASEDCSDYIYSKIMVNKKDEVIGREIGVGENEDNTPVFTWKKASDNDSTAISVECKGEDAGFSLTGSGTCNDELLTGDYVLAIEGTETMDIHVENLDIKPEKAGYYNGKFVLTPPVDTSENADSNPLAGFAAEVTLTSDPSAETSRIDLTLTSSGSPLATLSIDGGYEEGTKVPESESLTPSYSVEDDSAITEYMKTINWETLAANANAAGVPEELVSQVQTLLEDAVQNVIDPQTTQEPSEAESSDDTENTGVAENTAA